MKINNTNDLCGQEALVMLMNGAELITLTTDYETGYEKDTSYRYNVWTNKIEYREMGGTTWYASSLQLNAFLTARFKWLSMNNVNSYTKDGD